MCKSTGVLGIERDKMKLYKDEVVKEITRLKTIERLKREGWSEEPVEPAPDVEDEAPKRRGRPPRGE